MADCVSLPNAAELVEQLRSETRFVFGDYEGGFALPTQKELKAADAIEQLLAENAKLKAELEAAVADLKYYGYCKNCSQCTTKYGFYLCKIHGTVYWNDTCDDWEWCGVQKEEE